MTVVDFSSRRGKPRDVAQRAVDGDLPDDPSEGTEFVSSPYDLDKLEWEMAKLQSISRSADDRPVIRQTTELADVVDLTLDAMKVDESLYQRDGRLVHVVHVTEAEADEQVALAGTPQIRIMATPTLRERLTRVALFEKFDKRSKRWESALPSDQVVAAVLARGEYPGIRPLVGVLEAPSIRPDGTIIQEPGYDEATAYLYEPTAIFPPVPSSPTQADARTALADLEEPFAEFPFPGPEHRAATIAALLTVMGRPAIRGSTPAILHDANVRGSGKTLKADTVSTIATGRATAKMQYPKDDEELEKILASYAMRGASLVNFDNVTRTFGGGPLDRCLTAGDRVELRVLGKNEVPSMRWTATIMATGNNMVIAGDTSRRVLLSRIESQDENPEERQGYRHHPLLPWVQENRPRLVVAALTILRAWYVAGKPGGGCKTWGSFEAWSSIIPPAIVFAGGADPMRTRPSATGEEDGEKRALVAILDGLGRLDPSGNGLTCKTIVDTLYTRERLRGEAAPDGYDDLREALEFLCDAPAGRPPSTQRLGKALQRLKHRRAGKRMLDAELDSHTKVVRWRVVAGNAGDSGYRSGPRAENGRCQSTGSGEKHTRERPQHPQEGDAA